MPTVVPSGSSSSAMVAFQATPPQTTYDSAVVQLPPEDMEMEDFGPFFHPPF